MRMRAYLMTNTRLSTKRFSKLLTHLRNPINASQASYQICSGKRICMRTKISLLIAQD